MACIVDGNEIVLTGTVGDIWWGDGFLASDVISALAQIGRGNPVTVRLNSGGGIATEGAAIHAALAAHKGAVTLIVEGIAASAASLLAMAADRLVMSLGAVMMIHDPSLVTWGTAADHAKSIEILDHLGASYADIYADKSKKTPAQCRELMKAETWLSPEEALAEGFADEVGGTRADEPTAFDYRAYAHAPSRLVTLAADRGWKPLAHGAPPRAQAAPINPSVTPEDPTMTEKPPAAQPTPAAPPPAADPAAEARARIKAITTAEAAVGREGLATHLAFETDLSAEAALATLAAAPKEAPTTDYAAARAAAAKAAGLAAPGNGGTEKAPATLDPKAVYAARAKARAGR